ncbi:MAG: M23 family metallopeptidase [Candidatus Woesearchaeota archaeon]
MKKKFIISIVALSIIIFIFLSTLFINEWLIVKKNEMEKQREAAKTAELEHKLERYKEQYKEVLEIRDQYRSSIKEILILLYNRDVPMHIGGGESVGLDDSDEIIFLQLRQTISTMQDDQRMLEDVKQYLTARKSFIDSFPFIWPVEGGAPRISSGYGFREDLFGDGKVHFHAGIDIPGKVGDEIIATASGNVRAVIYNDESVGNIIVLEHKFGFTTGYSHLKEILVEEGQNVERGDVIGLMGNEGLHSQGAHVHYEIRKNNQPIDPFTLLGTNY